MLFKLGTLIMLENDNEIVFGMHKQDMVRHSWKKKQLYFAGVCF